MSELGTGFNSAQKMLRNAAIVLFIATMVWAPFPLGGAIHWAPGVQEILLAICWFLWVLGSVGHAHTDRRYSRLIALPLLLFLLTLAWAVVQMLPWVPQSWVHPVWAMASETLGQPLAGTISLNPWRTEGEILKLASYLMAGGLAFQMGRRLETANLLLSAVITITAGYALYAFVLAFAGYQQVNVVYSVPYSNRLISGPFMLHNSFATYCGLGCLAAVAKLFAEGGSIIRSDRGWRRLVETALQYCFGRGAFLIVAVILTFSGVVASASRAGFVATMTGLAVLALMALVTTRGRSKRRWASLGALAAVAPILVILIISGGTLESRVGQLLASDTGDVIRFALWNSAQRMISDAPVLGLGLGTFEDAYPLYALQIFPSVMDKAHSDYLEFAAGLGLPAAIAWWTGILWLFYTNVRAVFVRHRYRTFAAVASSATILVAVHSAVDFSLQLPAVSLLYTVLLALGSAQCLPRGQI